MGVGVNDESIPLTFIPSREGREYFFEIWEENAQIERCKNIKIFY